MGTGGECGGSLGIYSQIWWGTRQNAGVLANLSHIGQSCLPQYLRLTSTIPQPSISDMNKNLMSRLRESQDMLRLLHHRNQNQHRQAKWWKWLSMLKRCIEKLIRDLQTSDAARSNARIVYMHDILIPRCHASVNTREALDLLEWEVFFGADDGRPADRSPG